MTTPTPEFRENETSTYPGHTPAKKSRRWVRPVAFSAAGVLTLFIGVGIGASGSDAPADAKPAPTATVTAEPIVETETVTETVEVTPEACITALDLSGEAISIGSQVIDAQSEALMIAAGALDNPFSVSDSDIDRIVELTGYIEDATGDMEAMTPAAGAASSECRGA